MLDLSGFLWVTFRDWHTIEPMERLCIPLYMLKPYQPVNVEIDCWHIAFATRSNVFMNFVLEKPLMSMVDELTRVVLNWADFRPIPSNYKKFAIMLTSNGH